MKILKNLYSILNYQEKKRAGLLFVLITIMAIFDMIGVASILPFIAVLTNPSLVETNLILNYFFQFSNIFGVKNLEQFIFILGITLFLLLVFSLTLKAFTTYFQARFVSWLEYSVGRRLVSAYLHQSYDWFLNHHSADLGKNILSEVSNVVGNGIGNLIEMISKFLIASAIIFLLISIDFKLAFIVGFTLISAYLVIFFSINTYLDRIGKDTLEKNQLRFTSISEAFGASKEIKVKGLEEAYIQNFSNFSKIFAENRATATLISLLPRFFLEAIAFGGILLIVLFMMSKTGDFNNALPIISLYAFAGYRLLPALQIVYACFTKIIYVGPSAEKLFKDLKYLKVSNLNHNKDVLRFNKEINFQDICYSYPNSSKLTLKNINLKILKNSKVGIIGATGSGKTTTVDILLGLLQPQNGALEVDGQIITSKNARAWQTLVGYVPQYIYLSDDSVAANIAFGVDKKDVDQSKLENVAKVASIHEFVLNELPSKYQTEIGERGIRLSGGQRQRIGIARALYHKPKVLVLDEATSALDNNTEELVMSALSEFCKNDVTIITIAHRLSTLKKCDKIFLLDKGKVTISGTYEEIIEKN